MEQKFDKTKLLGATRQVLAQIAGWTGEIYDPAAPERLIGSLSRLTQESPEDWEIAGSAGPLIERSVVLGHVGRVIDYLNTNVWHGDPSNLWSTLQELMAIYGVLENARTRDPALIIKDDTVIDLNTASSVFQILRIFFARVNLEFDNEALEIRELAAIAGLAEKTVRMAAVGQGKNPDLVTFKEGSRTLVKPDEARRWLATKNTGYRPIDWSEERSLPPVDPKNLNELGPYLRNLREKVTNSPKSLGEQLGWGDATIAAYKAIEDGGDQSDLSCLSFDVVMQLAQELCPAESSELVRIIDRVLHPALLEMKIAQHMPASTGN